MAKKVSKKAEKPKVEYAKRSAVFGWLRENDVDLFVENARVGDAFARCERHFKHMGLVVRKADFRDGRREAVKYWAGSCYSYSKAGALLWPGFDAIRIWTRKHRDEILEAPSIEFAARLARRDGVVANPELLRGSIWFMKVWREKEQAVASV